MDPTMVWVKLESRIFIHPLGPPDQSASSSFFSESETSLVESAWCFFHPKVTKKHVVTKTFLGKIVTGGFYSVTLR